MLIVKVMVLVGLVVVFVQDMIYRAVSWIVFPVLALALGFLNWTFNTSAVFWQGIFINMCFLGFVMLAMSLYYVVKARKLINIMSGVLGWGDLLLLATVACYLSLLNYVLFYLLSLLLVVLIWLIWQGVTKHKSSTIPLAGLQALLFAIFLSADWWILHINTMSDNWLLAYLTT